jgi:octaprenyl-diphosphate synthase
MALAPSAMGCVVELLHTATLIHDDVVDQAPLRRGRPSANARWGDDASILVGDHLYSKSFALMVADGDPSVLATLALATVSMTEAEVLQLQCKRDGTASEADYLRIITQKTASFISACCRIGGLLAKANEDQVDALTRYGESIGIAFQISDDSSTSWPTRAASARRWAPTSRRASARFPSSRPSSAPLRRVGSRPVRAEAPRRGAGRDRGDPPPRRALRRCRIRARARPGLCAERQAGPRRFPRRPDKETLLLVADYVVERDT